MYNVIISVQQVLSFVGLTLKKKLGILVEKSEIFFKKVNKLRNKTMVRLMCVLRAHIKFSIFRNIFSGIKKTVITFSILEKIFFKNGNYDTY